MARVDMDLVEGGTFAPGLVDFSEANVAVTNGEALFQLGLASATGRTGDVDRVTAHKWFNLAAARGVAEAVSYRQELAVEMTSEEVREAQRQAREWMTLH